jgi:diaminohydroxyphosphoribosylaminopyrimidine deaminase / 5-amino-6-(5-phosphoribosylamino)uracil reductase
MNDEVYMCLALDLARRGEGTTSPNPMVGAVVVRGEEVVGRGFHERAGGDHAEVAAIREAGMRAAGATIYVTLEPCSHHGRTPPCVDRILSCGAARVVCAMTDPDPRVSGRGVAKLREAGLRVEVGLLEPEARRLNAFYIKHRTAGLPFVILKWAQSLDGRIASASGDSRWITGEAARGRAHGLRARVDAVMVGAGTVLADDPRLTVRMAEGRDPARIVLDSALRVPVESRVFGPGRAIVAATGRADEERARRLGERGVEVWRLPEREGRVDLRALMAELGRRDFLSVMIEGGAEVAASALREGVVDQVWAFVAPALIGAGKGAIGELGVAKIADAFGLEEMEVERVGEDWLCVARVGARRSAGPAAEVPCSPA